MPGWLRSEQMAGFDRNRWLQSSEYANTGANAKMIAAKRSGRRSMMASPGRDAAFYASIRSVTKEPPLAFSSAKWPKSN
jgi:hypothetical protein